MGTTWGLAANLDARFEMADKHDSRRFSKYVDKVYDPLKVGSIDGTDTEPHDYAIVRAINSEYAPNKKVKGKPHKTLFVSRLNPRTTEETIKTEFSKFGKIANCRLVRDIVTGESKKYAFVEFESRRSLQEAYDKMHRYWLEDSELLVDYEAERSLKGWKPRRLGGGFGGRRETGQLRFGCRDRPFQKPIVFDDKRKSFGTS